MPPTSCGARTAFGCSRWTTAGAGYSPFGTPSSAACVQASPPFSRSPWGLRLYASNGSRLPVSVGPLHQPDQVLGHPAVLRLRRTAQTNGVAERFNRTLKEQIIHGRIYRNIAELPRVRRTVQCPVDRGEERLPEPRSSSSGVAHRDVTQARRMRQTCVQGTGCDTPSIAQTMSFHQQLPFWPWVSSFFPWSPPFRPTMLST